MSKEQALVKLFELISFYYENRDRPIENGFNFHEEVKSCCQVLEVDKQIIIEKFNLHPYKD